MTSSCRLIFCLHISTIRRAVCASKRSPFTCRLSRALRLTDDVLDNITPLKNVISIYRRGCLERWAARTRVLVFPSTTRAQVQANPAHSAVAVAILA
jgi:hypothetical protein